ncbi:MAG TPA: methyltransferase domain-containing protein [Thermoanaerobaculia bacterium]|jgi:ubiquinone/menaquinone biosynthesis C-methylase UbiE|nr:methyltransferase domain-containing protein [Thermoanaerobaculia bacterium]
MKRIESEELLDEHDVPRADMERSLRDLRRINKYCGGVSVYRKLVRQFAPKSIVDIGTGTSDLLESVGHVPLRVGVDFKIDHLLYLRDGSRVHRVVGDAHHLPFRDGAVDLVTSSHFFHHFSPDENVGILNESLRVARNVATTDTRRHYLPLLFVYVLGMLRAVGRITRLDAPASVRQGYTVAEVRDVAARVQASKTQVVRKWPFRWALSLSRA